nr:CPBP family intramembrane metalloprotease [Chloroflexota bacterium]
MWTFLVYALPLGIIAIANLGVRHRAWRWLTHIGLCLLNALAIFAGLLLLRATHPMPPMLEGMNLGTLGLAFIAMGMLGFACLSISVRRALAHWLDIDPASPVHTTALVFLVYLAALSLGTLLSGWELQRAAAETVGIAPESLVFGQLFFVLLALAGVGLGIRRNVRQTLARLGLSMPSLRHLKSAIAMIAAFLFLDYVTSWLWHQFWPVHYRMVMEATQRLFAPYNSPAGALLLALSAGIGEETLFRGALQPRFRIALTAAVFALGHMQYTLSPAILEIWLIGLALGWLRQKSNTMTCMIVHIGYNFLDMFLMRFLP